MTHNQKLVSRSINAARKANHEALRLRAAGDIASAQVAREFCLVNMAQAKRTKSRALQHGQWA